MAGRHIRELENKSLQGPESHIPERDTCRKDHLPLCSVHDSEALWLRYRRASALLGLQGEGIQIKTHTIHSRLAIEHVGLNRQSLTLEKPGIPGRAVTARCQAWLPPGEFLKNIDF